ncbi:DUF4290 domain-containing protein [Sphingobacterium thalpophilum]|uniref:DUF4290 domain-containing protein n=1 Tax=Sphingobacterium thalpophilum TaxID=259 RepID=A0A4U9U9U0_9SPHI|nr:MULTISPECIES: DUF4290 domain-containing protein [Sphingobacterium]MCW8309777.1 DUF4290 domain-containing protein [Sphingobacterium sp. InxBP1]VTR29915.1 Uncharacterised protein [Sphingobacterium thalpophilum]
MNFDYNSTRPKLILAEYGRNVQNMVDYICTLPTKEERNKHAQIVIDMMGVLNPHLRDVSDFKHKLWDHLQIISDFKLDIDSPYPIATAKSVKHEVEHLGYPQHAIKYKHYGYTVEKMIEKALKLTDDTKKEQMVLGIANFMKMAYLTWNKDSVSDELIIQDLKELSGYQLTLPEGTVLTKLDFKTPPPGNRVKGAANSNSGNNNNNNNNNASGQSKGGSKPRIANSNNNAKRSNFSNNNNNNNRNRKPQNNYSNKRG